MLVELYVSKERGGCQVFSISFSKDFWMRFSQAPLCRYRLKVIFDAIIFLLSDNIIYAFDISIQKICHQINDYEISYYGIEQHTRTRIEPVGKPYREVWRQTILWSWKVHQPNSQSKHPGTWIEHVLAYCRVGRKYWAIFYSISCHLQILALTAVSVLSHYDLDLWRTDLQIYRINGKSSLSLSTNQVSLEFVEQ